MDRKHHSWRGAASIGTAGVLLGAVALACGLVAGAPAATAPAKKPPETRLLARPVPPLPVTKIQASYSPSGQPHAEEEEEDKHRMPRLPLGTGGLPRVRTQAVRPEGVRLPGPSPLANTDDLGFAVNSALPASAYSNTGNLSSTAEPSVAVNGNVILYTSNWFAAVSTNGGTTYQYVSPYSTFPQAGGEDFCCDQVVHYIPQIDTFVWLLQYMENETTHENVDRLVFATTAEVQANTWHYVDLTSQGLGIPGQWMDFPDLSYGTNNLYLTTNVFDGNDNITHSLVVRIPLSGLQGAGSLSGIQVVTNENNVYGPRLAQNLGTTAYWAAHYTLSSMRVYAWDEASSTPTARTVGIAAWNDAVTYSSTTPDGFNWLGFADSRILGATLTGNELWFAWSAAPRPATGQTQAYVEVARISTSNWSLLGQPAIWNPNFAYAYPSLNTNTDGEVGVSISYGGGTTQLSHAVGILTGTLKLVTTRTGSNGPSRGRWGDYLTIRRWRPNGKLFAATGFTLQGGNGNANSEPRYVVFGRSGDLVPTFSISGTITL
ncbi:MAG TPA: hypothetical protein VFU47_07575, partial [Armatimonadota bacterium]|nr:hypothetical protein [Armatimonadota bacterium]